MQGLEQHEDIQAVLSDIMSIRRSITSFQKNKEGRVVESSYKANKFVQFVSLILGALLILIEWLGHNLITNTMIEKNSDSSWRLFGVICIGLFLALCVVILYFAVNRAAVKVQDDLQSYIKRNFTYLQNLSHISDLIIKFVVISALIWGQKPEWVAPFLLLFIGDYLLQGRLFSLKIRQAQILAMLSVVGAIAMFALHNVYVIWPLIWFFIVNVISFRHLRNMKRVDD